MVDMTNVDPTVALAIAMHASPGTFALLVGSGISRAARIPTGWDVVVDLLRKLAVLTEADEPDDPVAWFTSRGGEPDYSKLLEQLAPTAADRRNLLNAYFEPTAEEREEGIKTPTRAHRAIARLVASGHVRVIVTPNFDRLLEAAIREEGIEPVVISSAAAAAGATPLAHTRCTVIKLHGDYLEPDLKNTVAELGSYDPALDRLLDQVVDEYGLVICGWSGVWDQALRNAILRAPSRRYGTYWTRVGTLDERAQQLVLHRGAVEVAIAGADEFFEELAAKVAALQDLAVRRPLSTEIAVAELKRYLPNPVQRIRLHDLVIGETARVLALPAINANSPQPSVENVSERMHLYESTSATLVALLAALAYFGDRPEHDDLALDAIRRVAGRPVDHNGFSAWIDLERYPATLALYGLAIGALARGRVAPLAAALGTVRVPHPNQDLDLAYGLASWQTLDATVCNALVVEDAERQRHKTPVSQYLWRAVPPMLDGVLPISDLERVFNEAEYLLGFACTAAVGRGPVGRFALEYSSERYNAEVVRRHREALLEAGVASGDAAKFDEAIESYQAEVSRRSW